MSATYTKLRDESWGIRVLGTKPHPGEELEVTKKSGDAKTEKVLAVLWSGTDKDTGRPVHLCSVVPGAPKKCGGVRSRGSRAGGETKSCWECGCDFTYADAQRRGGDWGDSYCGC